MGLDTSHDCFHGAYSSFTRWRAEIAKAAGFGVDERGHYCLNWDLYEYKNYFGKWDAPPDDPLMVLLIHSDCEGEIPSDLCGPLADRLETLLPRLPVEGDGHLARFGVRGTTERFIAGLREAAKSGEPVDFH